jgi:hypothetical protein
LVILYLWQDGGPDVEGSWFLTKSRSCIQRRSQINVLTQSNNLGGKEACIKNPQLILIKGIRGFSFAVHYHQRKNIHPATQLARAPFKAVLLESAYNTYVYNR